MSFQEANDALNALLWGNGSWLMLIIILIAFIIVVKIEKYSSGLVIPIAIFMGIEYLNHNLGWQALLMFISTIFFSGYAMKESKRG